MMLYLAARLSDLTQCKRVYVPEEFIQTGRVVLYDTKDAAETALFACCATAMLEKEEWIIIQLASQKLGKLYDPKTRVLTNAIEVDMLVEPLLKLN